MLTAPALSLDTLPDFRITDGKIDHRTGNGVAFLHEGSYYDSFEQAMQFERWVFQSGPGLPTPEELSEKRTSERISLVALSQPGDADAGGL